MQKTGQIERTVDREFAEEEGRYRTLVSIAEQPPSRAQDGDSGRHLSTFVLLMKLCAAWRRRRTIFREMLKLTWTRCEVSGRVSCCRSGARSPFLMTLGAADDFCDLSNGIVADSYRRNYRPLLFYGQVERCKSG